MPCNADAITAYLAATMRARRVTQRAAAAELDVTVGYLNRRLTGAVPMSLEDTLALASLLEVDLGDLLNAASADTSPQASALAATTGAAGGRP